MRQPPYCTLRLVTFLLAGLLSLQFKCQKNLDCHNTYYNFELGIMAYPDRESIAVGDTLWLEVSSPTTLEDKNTGRLIDYSGAANLGSAIAFQRLSGTNQFSTKAANQFDYKLVLGKETSNADPELLREYLFGEERGRYGFKLAVIAKEPGTYRLFFSNATSVFRKGDECTKAAFELNFTNTNQHVYLFPNHSGPQSGGGVYYFKVVP